MGKSSSSKRKLDQVIDDDDAVPASTAQQSTSGSAASTSKSKSKSKSDGRGEDERNKKHKTASASSGQAASVPAGGTDPSNAALSSTVGAAAAAAASAATTPTTTLATQRASLSHSFGTKKAVRALKAAERSRVNESSYGLNAANDLGHLLSSGIAGAVAAGSFGDPSAAAHDGGGGGGVLVDKTKDPGERPGLPRPNLTTRDPAQSYAFDTEICPAAEIAALRAVALRIAQTPGGTRARSKCLAFRHSSFINDRLRMILPKRHDEKLAKRGIKPAEGEVAVATEEQGDKQPAEDDHEDEDRREEDDDEPLVSEKDLTRLSTLVLLSVLLEFRRTCSRRRQGGVDKLALASKLSNVGNNNNNNGSTTDGGRDVNNSNSSDAAAGVPPLVVDALVDRYTEPLRNPSGGPATRVFTSVKELLLLSHVCLIALRLERFNVEITPLAHDLALGVKKVEEHFRALGCRVVALSQGEREKLVANSRGNLTMAEARSRRRAVLKTPLEFPKEKRGAPQR